MVTEKPFWLSKTVWLNGLTAIFALLNKQFGLVEVSPAEVAGFLTIANLVLRAVSSGKVTLS